MKLVSTYNELSREEINQEATKLSSYISNLQDIVKTHKFDHNESSILLSSDDKTLNDVNEMGQQFDTSELGYVIVIGIGGSNLGTKAVYDALYGSFDILEPHRFPKMIFADTNDPEILYKMQELLKTVTDKNKILINIISKSGGTTETIVNLELILKMFKNDYKDRLVVTTDENSPLYITAIRQNIKVLTLPNVVGGRYSVLSTVGLFPMKMIGVDIISLRNGAEKMGRECLVDNPNLNPALISAASLYLHLQKGKVVHDHFIFRPELETLGKWYRQLMGESIGKLGKGMLPTVSIGSTDLHSMAQLYLGGPSNIFFTFITTQNNTHDLVIPENLQFPNLVPNIEGKNTTTIMSSIYEGVKKSYITKHLPFLEVILEDLKESSLGEFFQFKMFEMMYLAQLLNINAFDQPEVELYKIETKKILSKES